MGRTGLDRLYESGKLLPFAIQVALIDSSDLFERDWYLKTYPNVANSGGDPLEHYIHHGASEWLDPNRLFDTTWYYATNPELRLMAINPLVHYILAGAAENRLPHMSFPQQAVVEAMKEGYDRTPLALFLTDLLPNGAMPFPEFENYDRIRAIEAIDEHRDRDDTARHIAVMVERPFFLVLMIGRPGVSDSGTVASLARQSYPDHKLMSSVAEASAFGRTAPQGTYLLTIVSGDELVDDALYHLASALNAAPDTDLLYFDQDHLDEHGRRKAPFYKPEWSPDYLESINYVGTCACYAYASVAPLLKDGQSSYDLTLRFTETARYIKRLPRVLVSCRDDLNNYPDALQQSDIDALGGRFARSGRQAIITPCRPAASAYVATVIGHDRATISVVIPTAGKIVDYEGRRIDLIVNCLETISAKSDTQNIEFILVDNGDFDRSRLDHLSELAIRCLTYDGQDVNIATKINIGAAAATGEFILILNDDIEPLTSDWIDRMLMHFAKPHVGAVGAKLLFPSTLVQHVGLAICDGMPAHVCRFASDSSEGYFYSSLAARNCSSVTGAVCMVRRSVFEEVGGYEQNLPIDFNDIDFSYKVTEAGYTIVCEPQARLTHFESVSAIRQPRPWDAVYFAKKWAHLVDDRYYDRLHLDKNPPMYAVALTQRSH